MTTAKSRHESAQINIIPLLDVLLVLVAVLLLLTPFMAKSINVDLPNSKTGETMTQESAITLEIRADGTVLHEGAPVKDWKKLYVQMKTATTAKIYADKGASFAAVTTVLDNLASNDIHNVQFGIKQ